MIDMMYQKFMISILHWQIYTVATIYQRSDLWETNYKYSPYSDVHSDKWSTTEIQDSLQTQIKTPIKPIMGTLHRKVETAKKHVR